MRGVDRKEEKVVVDGAVLEKVTYFYKSSEVEYVLNFKDDKPHGKFTWCHENGVMGEASRYKEGARHGRSIWFDEEGCVDVLHYYQGGKDITEEVVEFLEENPPIDELYPAFVEGYFKLKYGLSLEELDIKVEDS